MSEPCKIRPSDTSGPCAYETVGKHEDAVIRFQQSPRPKQARLRLAWHYMQLGRVMYWNHVHAAQQDERDIADLARFVREGRVAFGGSERFVRGAREALAGNTGALEFLADWLDHRPDVRRALRAARQADREGRS